MESFDAFKEKLDREHNWPTTYLFKFVVPSAKAEELKEIFVKESIQTKDSKSGKYVSFTIKKLINSSDEVIEIYIKAGEIEGLIAL